MGSINGFSLSLRDEGLMSFSSLDSAKMNTDLSFGVTFHSNPRRILE